MTSQRLSFDISPADLIPHPNFESDIRQALAAETPAAKFNALDRVFENWGDVIATVFELGASLSTSDAASQSAQDQHTNRTAGFNILGGDTLSAPEEIMTWLSKTRHPSQWSMARIIRVIPVTDLLQNDLKRELHELYSNLLSYRPPVIEGNSIGGRSFDGTPHALKTIRGITIFSDSLVDALKVAYTDGIDTGRLGGPGGNEQAFCLQRDEFIVEIFVWTDPETTIGMQFATSKGRISPHYGGEGGVPSVYNCGGVALSALSGRIKKNYYSKKDAVYRIQAIWRHNLVPLGLPHGHKYSKYVGGIGGSPFNDWPYMGPAESAYVSGIAIQGGKYIDSIQATYTITNGAQSQTVEKPEHGATVGDMTPFTLRQGEYFVKVQGRSSDYIIQLCFTTNRGRSTEIYGRSDQGKQFKSEAPEGMRLAFIMGKSSTYLHGLLLAWAPV